VRVTRFAVRAWIDRGLLSEPPWTCRSSTGRGTWQDFDLVRRRRTEPGQGGHMVVVVRSVARRKTDTARAYGRARAQDRLSTEVRQQLLPRSTLAVSAPSGPVAGR
jgi:hypothetical protein